MTYEDVMNKLEMDTLTPQAPDPAGDHHHRWRTQWHSLAVILRPRGAHYSRTPPTSTALPPIGSVSYWWGPLNFYCSAIDRSTVLVLTAHIFPFPSPAREKLSQNYSNERELLCFRLRLLRSLWFRLCTTMSEELE
jgi:hypothetical protein